MGCCGSKEAAAESHEEYLERRERLRAAAEEREAAQYQGISAKGQKKLKQEIRSAQAKPQGRQDDSDAAADWRGS